MVKGIIMGLDPGQELPEDGVPALDPSHGQDCMEFDIVWETAPASQEMEAAKTGIPEADSSSQWGRGEFSLPALPVWRHILFRPVSGFFAPVPGYQKSARNLYESQKCAKIKNIADCHRHTFSITHKEPEQ